MNTAPALIFVIEDELSIARLVQSVLVEFGFEVECFHTGASALRRLAVRRPDLCITDLGLPDMDGIDLVRQISQQCPCGLLILSGRGHTADRIMGLELGGDDYVTKPFEPRELVARVRSILRRRGQVPGGGQSESRRQACFLNWTLDCSANTLRADDGTEHLLGVAEVQRARDIGRRLDDRERFERPVRTRARTVRREDVRGHPAPVVQVLRIFQPVAEPHVE